MNPVLLHLSIWAIRLLALCTVAFVVLRAFITAGFTFADDRSPIPHLILLAAVIGVIALICVGVDLAERALRKHVKHRPAEKPE